MRVAFVVPRYGETVCGGAETLCRDTAERMARYWDVEVLTTCAESYFTWKDHFPPGVESSGGVTVRRFRVDAPRSAVRSMYLHRQVYSPKGVPELEPSLIKEVGPYSSDYLRYLDDRGRDYDLFIFFSYAFATTFFGLPKVADRSILIPLAHDESALFLGAYRRLFSSPRLILLNTPAERRLVRQRHPVKVPMKLLHPCTIRRKGGEPRPDRFLRKHAKRIRGPFLLYVGRVDPYKGCDHLVEYFSSFRRQSLSRSLQLVLMGQEFGTLPWHPDIIRLGFVSEAEKRDALAACSLFVMPSAYESLCLSLLEAWEAGAPALVNGHCPVLQDHCRKSGGGLLYYNQGGFSAALEALLDDETERRRMGERGRLYVKEEFSPRRMEQALLRWGKAIAGTPNRHNVRSPCLGHPPRSLFRGKEA